MKFNKLLKSGVAGEDDPQQQDGSASLYVRYGALKKQLKVMAHVLNHDNEGAHVSQAGVRFVQQHCCRMLLSQCPPAPRVSAHSADGKLGKAASVVCRLTDEPR